MNEHQQQAQNWVESAALGQQNLHVALTGNPVKKFHPLVCLKQPIAGHPTTQPDAGQRPS